MNPRIALTILSLSAPVAAQEALFALGGPQLVAHEPNTGAVLFTQQLSSPPDSFWRMTHDGSRILGIDEACCFHLDRLFTIHPADAHGTDLGNTGQSWRHYAIEWVPQTSTLWVVYGDAMYTVDRATGVAAFHGWLTGLLPFDAVTAMAVDPSGVIYGTGYALSGSPNLAVYQLDLLAGTAMQIASWPFASFASMGWFTDLAFTGTGVLWGVYDSWVNAAHMGLYRIDLQSLSAVQVLSQPNSFYRGIAVGPLTSTANYCTAKVNSLGCPPQMDAEGIASPTAVSGFRVEATGVRNVKGGALFYGMSGQAALPFAGGMLCVAAPIFHTPIVSSGGNLLPFADCSGVLSVDFNTYLQTQPLLPAGTTIQCQWISRDPGFAPPNNLSLTNALQFTLLP